MADPYDLVATEGCAGHATAIARFWQQFTAAADALDRGFSAGEVAGSLDVMAELQAVHPDLMWEFGPSDRGHALCITAEWRDALRPLARAVLAAAPDLPRWRFSDARGAAGAAGVAELFEARAQEPLQINAMQAVAGRDGRIGLDVMGHGAEDRLSVQAQVLAEIVLGEAACRDWVGQVTLRSGPGLLARLSGRRPVFDAATFVAGFAAVRAQMRDALPGPLAQHDPDAGPIGLLRMKAMREGSGRPDLVTFSTASDTYATAALDGRGFASCNHSRHGEFFAFLRVPHDGTPPLATDVGARAEIEAALHRVLSQAGIGGLVAAGHGTAAVYLDFGMTDLRRGLELLARSFAPRPWAQRATIHFLEAGLSAMPISLIAPQRVMQ